MKFKLIEKFDETRDMVQEYMYDAMDELNNASLEEYIQWFKSELTYYDDEVERAVTDAYIEACDYGMIKGVEKTRLTSELKEYIELNAELIDKDIDELINNCPDHLKHELTLVLDKINDSLNEGLLTEKTKYSAELATHSLSDSNTRDYNLHGLKSIILKRYAEPLKRLCVRIANNNELNGAMLFDDIKSSDWTTHHINGIHKDSSTSDLNNLALVINEVHKELTDKNKQIIEELLNNQKVTGDEDIDKLILRLLVVLHSKNVKPSSIFRVPVHNHDTLMNKIIPEAIANNFYEEYPESTQDVVRLIDLDLK